MVSTTPGEATRNQLLQILTHRDRKRLREQAEPVELVFGEMLCEVGRPYRHVYFPLTGFVSLVISVGKHQPLEMGLIGNEGMLGATLLLDVNDSPLRAVVQGAGTALRVPAALFRLELRECAPLAGIIRRYLYVLMSQLSQTAACTCFHEIDRRLARWLLMTHDRAQTDSFQLTHQLLADMLGVRRSAVTIAAGDLQGARLISYTRGTITVINRKGLERAACECYQAVAAAYARRFPATH